MEYTMWTVQNEGDALTGPGISKTTGKKSKKFKKVNYSLLSLLLFQAASFIQKMINSAFKKTDTHKSQYA